MAVRLVLYLFLCLRLLQIHCSHPCADHTTCKECIRAHLSCKWCSSGDFDKTQRCMAATNDLIGCAADLIEDPKGSVNSTGFNHDFSSDTQVKPQRFKIKLRPGEVQTFDFTFKAAKNFPADLYFLFDSSSTMLTTLTNIANASEKIYKEIQKKTNDVQLGMGTFVDKNTAPMVRDDGPISSFNHKLNMTSNYTHFEQLVNKVAADTKKNYDTPEGGFDALAQVIACENQIGWRGVSRKIIFFLTDAPCHSAGDGKLAGIVYPYDGKCYTKDGNYTKELEMDYPSRAIISELAAMKGVTIIFLVDANVRDYYIDLAKQIQGSKTLTYKRYEVLNTSKLEKIITQIYEEIEQTIKLGITRTPEELKHINITFEPDCLNTKKNDPNCIVTHEQARPFRGNINLLEYYGKDNITLNVTFGNGINERLTLDIEVVECDCKIKFNSPYCSGHGTEKCGVCECDKDRTGKKCECKANENSKVEDMGCRPGSDKDKLPCNGEGYCECGSCKCNEGREGEFCECLTDTCVDKCNGHGKCYCGNCTCHIGWTGDTCDCHEKPCKIINGKTCNGRGHCQCGACKCNSRAEWDAREVQNRETCEMKPCTSCHNDQCLKLRECAICRQTHDQNHCSSTCGNGDIQVVVVQSLINTTHENGSVCENMQAGLGCYTRFQYQYDDVNYNINLLVQTENDCIENYYKWGGTVLVTLLIIGLLTLLAWKLLTDLRDRREYQRFLKEHSGEGLESRENPIYEPATTTIRNPAFRKPSVDYNLK